MLTHELLATALDFCSKVCICREAQQGLSALLLCSPSAALLLLMAVSSWNFIAVNERPEREGTEHVGSQELSCIEQFFRLKSIFYCHNIQELMKSQQSVGKVIREKCLSFTGRIALRSEQP